MLNTTNRYKSQYEILYILVYTKNTKSDILYSEQYTLLEKNLTRSAPNMVARSAWPVRCGYYATGKYLPIAHG
jgi:hypothetical protein